MDESWMQLQAQVKAPAFLTLGDDSCKSCKSLESYEVAIVILSYEDL